QADSQQDAGERSEDEEDIRTVDEYLDEVTNVQKAIENAYRYVGMYARDVYEHTPAEVQLMRRASVERRYDELEQEATIAIMHGNAANSKKRVRATDLFKRPAEHRESKRTADDLRREEEEAMKWLGQCEQFSDVV